MRGPTAFVTFSFVLAAAACCQSDKHENHQSLPHPNAAPCAGFRTPFATSGELDKAEVETYLWKPELSYLVGLHFLCGTKGKESHAARYLLEAASSGYGPAQVMVGHMYSERMAFPRMK